MRFRPKNEDTATWIEDAEKCRNAFQRGKWRLSNKIKQSKSSMSINHTFDSHRWLTRSRSTSNKRRHSHSACFDSLLRTVCFRCQPSRRHLIPFLPHVNVSLGLPRIFIVLFYHCTLIRFVTGANRSFVFLRFGRYLFLRLCFAHNVSITFHVRSLTFIATM